MGETPNQRVKRDAGSRQGKCLGSRCRDLIGQPECGLEALIGWESLARTHTRTCVCPERSEVADACVPQFVSCTNFLEGSSGVVATNLSTCTFLVLSVSFTSCRHDSTGHFALTVRGTI